MTNTYKVEDITRDLTAVLKLTRIFTADDEGFWIDADTQKRYVHKLEPKDDGKEIVIFQDPLPKGDFYFFNPYAEGLGKKSPASQLFYKTLRIGFDLALERAVMYMVEVILEHKQACVEDPNHRLPSAITRMSGLKIDKKTTVLDAIDDEMKKEFTKLFSRMTDGIVFVPYLPQLMTTKVHCDVLTDPKWDEKFGNELGTSNNCKPYHKNNILC
jgi:hypothetical protein